MPVADARQSPPSAAATPSQAKPPEPASEPATPFATDDRGFVDSNARCQATQTALAIGRTPQSLVVICVDENGQYEYLGVRLRDDAVMKTVAQSAPARGFLARNYSVTYAVSPTELLVTAGDTVIKQEPMIEYREARSVAAKAAPR